MDEDWSAYIAGIFILLASVVAIVTFVGLVYTTAAYVIVYALASLTSIEFSWALVGLAAAVAFVLSLIFGDA